MDKELPISPWPEWKIVSKIGEGSFGRVYKAQRTEKGRSFYSAIKIITIPASKGELDSEPSESGHEKSVRGKFENLVEECIQEVSTMEYFRGNSHIVSVEDYKVMEYLDEIGWDIFIRMEYLTSFMEYYAGKNLTEKEVMKLGIDLCRSLEYCGQLHIIHRDIKPENIFVSRFGDFKLGDFGIARELEKTMSTLSKKGTYSYMAPEMYRGEQYDSRVDIYALGLVLYKLMNHNRLPFLNLEKQLITYMVGRELSDDYPEPKRKIGETLLKVEHLKNKRVHDVSFELKKGEILGFGGLVGAGRTELVRAIYGADPIESGTIIFNGKKYSPKSPADGLEAGIGLIPEDRKAQGCVLSLTIRENIVYSILKKISKVSVVQKKQEKEIVDQYIKELNVKTPSPEQLVKNLSGGNQQKVVLAKALATNCEILIFDEPTRGIDVGAKQEIYNLMCKLVEAGKSIIMISSEMPELIGMSDRIVVMSNGENAGELSKGEYDQTHLLEMASSKL